jgi:hypothetical protein
MGGLKIGCIFKGESLGAIPLANKALNHTLRFGWLVHRSHDKEIRSGTTESDYQLQRNIKWCGGEPVSSKIKIQTLGVSGDLTL